MQIDLPSVINNNPEELHIKTHYDRLVLKISKRIYARTRAAESQNWRCCFCGVACVEEPDKRNSATLEHVTPKAFGGTDTQDNFAMSCNACNNKRGTTDALVFFARRRCVGG